jgi:hypothetical protein
MTREEYLFTYSPKLRSRRHYTLREYLERRLRGESGVQASVPDEASHPAPPTPPGPPAPPAPAVGSTVGKAAPEIEGRLAGGTGPQFKLSTLKGKAVILLFGVGYDPFAVSGARRLAEAQRSVPAGRMASVVVLMDAPSARRDVAAEAAKFRVPQECLPEVDLKKTAADYGLTSAGGAANCSLLVLDRNGVIRYRTDRDLLVSLRSPEFIKVMRGLLPEADWAALLEPRTKK